MLYMLTILISDSRNAGLVQISFVIFELKTQYSKFEKLGHWVVGGVNDGTVKYRLPSNDQDPMKSGDRTSPNNNHSTFNFHVLHAVFKTPSFEL